MEMQVDIKRVQNRLFQMGQVIANILSTHNIPHMITFGTLLGAVRHGGFIPWDDDFDFFLFDDTYDEAIKILRNELPVDMFLEDDKSEPKYFHGWAHVKDLNSEVYCEQFPQDNLYEHHGLSVDLYRCKKINSSEIVDYRINELKRYLNRKLENKIISQEKYDIELARLRHNIEKEENENPAEVNSSIFAMAVKERYMLESDVLPLRKYLFDSTEFWGPDNCDGILTHFYGDYMKLPKEEDRIPHYSKVIFKENVKIINLKDSRIDVSVLKNFITRNDYLFPDPFSNHVDISTYVDKLYSLGEILVAIDNNTICGVACAYMNDLVLQTFFLQLFVVDKNHQGQGIGSSLLLNLFDLGKQNGMTRGRLVCDRNNVSAERLYKKIGWFDSNTVHENPAKKYLDIILV